MGSAEATIQGLQSALSSVREKPVLQCSFENSYHASSEERSTKIGWWPGLKMEIICKHNHIIVIVGIHYFRLHEFFNDYFALPAVESYYL